MITLNREQKKMLIVYLKVIKLQFRKYSGMATGSATIHNIYPKDLKVIDEVLEQIYGSFYD